MTWRDFGWFAGGIAVGEVAIFLWMLFTGAGKDGKAQPEQHGEHHLR
jgi:hypothetical protein